MILYLSLESSTTYLNQRTFLRMPKMLYTYLCSLINFDLVNSTVGVWVSAFYLFLHGPEASMAGRVMSLMFSGVNTN